MQFCLVSLKNKYESFEKLKTEVVRNEIFFWALDQNQQINNIFSITVFFMGGATTVTGFKIPTKRANFLYLHTNEKEKVFSSSYLDASFWKFSLDFWVSTPAAIASVLEHPALVRST